MIFFFFNTEYHTNPIENDYFRGIIWELWRGDYSLRKKTTFNYLLIIFLAIGLVNQENHELKVDWFFTHNVFDWIKTQVWSS